MATNNAAIQAAIAAGDITLARNLIRDALNDAPDAETYFLAAQVALDEAQRRGFLERALQLDPFHTAAHAALRSAVPVSAAPTAPLPSASVTAPRSADAAPSASSISTRSSRSGWLIAVAAIALLGGAWYTFLRPAPAKPSVRPASPASVRSTVAIAPTATLTPHQRAVAVSTAPYNCSYNMTPQVEDYLAPPANQLLQLESSSRFLIVEALSEANNAALQVQQSDGRQLKSPTYAVARRSDVRGGQQMFYRYYIYHLSESSLSKPSKTNVFLAVPPVTQLRFRCIEPATVRSYVDQVALPHVLNLEFLVELAKINGFVNEICGTAKSNRCR